MDSIAENTVAKKVRYMDGEVMYIMENPNGENLRQVKLATGDHVHVRSHFDGDTHYYISKVDEDGFTLIERYGNTQTERMSHEEMIEGIWNVTITWTDTKSWQPGTF